ncbi:hypothetical protein GCM10023155_24640 [Bremerella cremea]
MAKLKNLLAGCVFCALASTGFAEEKSKVATPSQDTLSMYHKALTDRHYHTAELLARGVLDKYGEENEFGQAMLSELDAYREVTEGPRIMSTYVRTIEAYDLSSYEGFATTDQRVFKTNLKTLVEAIRQEVGPRWDLFEVQADPFTTNLSVLVSAPQFVHEAFAKHLAEMRSARQEEVAN